MKADNLKVICGSACSPVLVENIGKRIRALQGSGDFQPVVWSNHQFKDGEFLPQIGENVRGADVFVVQPTFPPEENFKQLKLLLFAATLASAESVTAVLPYMRDLRQDRKDRPRVAITAKMSLEEIENAMKGASRRHVIFFHPHFSQVQGYLSIATSDILYPTAIFKNYLDELSLNLRNVVTVASDAGGAKLAEIYAWYLGLNSFAVGMKVRDGDDRVRIEDIIGDVDGKTALVFEDIIDTAGTMRALAIKLRERGAREIIVFATHGVLAQGAIDNLREGGFSRVVITNSIYRFPGILPPFIDVVDCGELIGEAIFRTHTGQSISEIAGMYIPKKV